jgi:hypothetical protein
MFGFGSAETLVLVLLLVIFLGPRTLPDLAQAMRERFWPDQHGATNEKRRTWSRTEWLLAAAVLLLVSLVVALAARAAPA